MKRFRRPVVLLVGLSACSLMCWWAWSRYVDRNHRVVFPKVVAGKSGWLYVGKDFAYPCHPRRSLADTIRRLQQLDRIVTSSGRRFIFTIAPDKSTVDPQYLPDTYAGKSCATASKRALWDLLARDSPLGYLDLRLPLERQQRTDGEPIYLPRDTHWTSRGSIVFGRELADALEPSLWAGTRVQRVGTVAAGGELGPLIHDFTRIAAPVWTITRPGVSGNFATVGAGMPAGATPLVIENTTSRLALFGPRTLLIGDSFSYHSRLAVFPLFSHLVVLHQQRVRLDTVSAIANARVIVFELVERDFEGGASSALDDNPLHLIQDALAAK